MPAEAIGGLSTGVTPLEMADAYATLANGGIHHEPTAIGRVEFPSGKVDEPEADSGDRVLTEGQAYDVTKILERVITEGTGGPASIGCAAEAGKTGTSEELSDAWFVGYTPRYATAVWVGHPQSREETGYGGPTAGPIWRSFMEAANGGDCGEFVEPSSLPELSGLSGGHTSGSSGYRGEGEYEELEEYVEEGEEEAEEGGKGGAKAEAETAPSPAPPPTPAPAAPQGRGPAGAVSARADTRSRFEPPCG